MPATRSAPLLALAGLIATPAVLAKDAASGKAVFERLCAACHATTTEPGGPPTGPTLAGVMGRKSASVKEFPMYTPALKAHNVTWDEKSLDEFLANPMIRVPGTMMVMPVTDAKERSDVIAYLKTLKGK